MISQGHSIKGSCDLLTLYFKLSYHPGKCGDHKHSGSGDMFFFATSCWRDYVTSTCFVSLISCKSSKWICLSNLVVIGFMEMHISIIISMLAWMPRKTYCHTERFSKLGILIWNSEVPEKMSRRIQAISRRYSHALFLTCC